MRNNLIIKMVFTFFCALAGSALAADASPIDVDQYAPQTFTCTESGGSVSCSGWDARYLKLSNPTQMKPGTYTFTGASGGSSSTPNLVFNYKTESMWGYGLQANYPALMMPDVKNGKWKGDPTYGYVCGSTSQPLSVSTARDCPFIGVPYGKE